RGRGRLGSRRSSLSGATGLATGVKPTFGTWGFAPWRSSRRVRELRDTLRQRWLSRRSGGNHRSYPKYPQFLGAAAMTHRVTRAVRAGVDCDTAFGAVTPPIVLSSNFTFEEFGRKRTYDYSRGGNPTRDQLAGALADLECAVGAIVTSTGMAAIALVLQALLNIGDRLLVPHDCYGGSWRLFNALANRGAVVLDVVDFTNPEAVQKAVAQKPAMIWLETPSNPLLRITNIAEICKAAKAIGALVVAD